MQKKPFASICLAKVGYKDEIGAFDEEASIIKKYTDYFDSGTTHALGTLGWNELIFVRTGDDLADIAEGLMWATSEKFDNSLEKTSSFLALNHNLILVSFLYSLRR